MPRSKEETNKNWQKVGYGSRIAVYCKPHYYACKVVEEKDSSSKFKVLYEDATEEWVDLAKRKFRWQECWKIDSDDEEDKASEKEVSDKDEAEEEASKEGGDESVGEEEASTTKRKSSNAKDKIEDSDATPTIEDEKEEEDTKVVTPPAAKKTKVSEDEDYDDGDAGSDDADDDYSEGATQKKKTKKKPAKNAPKKTSKSSSAKKTLGGKSAGQLILDVIATLAKMNKSNTVPKDKVMAFVSCQCPMGKSTIANALTKHKKAGSITFDSKTVTITETGLEHADVSDDLSASNEEFHKKIQDSLNLNERSRQLFAELADGAVHKKKEVAEAMGMKMNSTWANMLTPMKKQSVVIYDRETIQLTDDMFPFGRPDN